MDIAGLSLDSVRPNYGPNFLEDAEFPNGILTRLAGAEITVELSYTNSVYKQHEDWSGIVCHIRINGVSE